jgi:carbonic anhydrase
MSRPYRLKNLLLVAVAGFAFSLSGVAQNSAQCPNPSSWSYPSTNWATLYPQCCSQANASTKDIQQSPINITTVTENANLTLQTSYFSATVPVVDNGHSIEVDYDNPPPGSKPNYVTWNGTQYNLLQFHFHQPNEHQINGAPTGAEQMEVHLVNVHTDAEGNQSFLVIGVLVNKGAANEGFGKILTHIGRTDSLDPVQMIPGTNNIKNPKLYTYMGSLTTPGCTPPITWVVLKEPITFSEAQLNSYGALHGGKYATTSRGVQTAITGLTVNSNFKP